MQKSGVSQHLPPRAKHRPGAQDATLNKVGQNAVFGRIHIESETTEMEKYSA